MPASGRNQTSLPALSTIIGPLCFWSFLDLAVRKTSPAAVGLRRGSTVTSGGVRSGRERKCRVAPALMFSRTRLGIVIGPGGLRMRKRVLAAASAVVTDTLSPVANRWLG